MEKITIFTPTYNRGEKLKKLYESLLQQTANDFIWLIVDDGSTDGTEDIVKEWMQKSPIAIRYYFQDNSGKMAAHNKGVLLCTTELFMCVDSDDYLTDNAVELILKNCGCVTADSSLCGIVAYKNIRVNNFPSKISYSTLSGLYHQGFRGEAALIFKTEILKRYLFPLIAGEKFITEVYVYDQIDDNYKYLILREMLIVAEYQEDGYTKNIINIQYNNPKGYALYFKQSIIRRKSFIGKLRSMTSYISFSLLSHCTYTSIIKESNNIFLCVLSFPLGICKLIWKKYEYHRYLKRTSC